MEEANWHLKPGAPAETVKEFNEFMQELNGDVSAETKPVKKSFTDQVKDILSHK